MDLTKQDKMYSKKVREDKKKVLFMSIYPDESNYLWKPHKFINLPN